MILSWGGLEGEGRGKRITAGGENACAVFLELLSERWSGLKKGKGHQAKDRERDQLSLPFVDDFWMGKKGGEKGRPFEWNHFFQFNPLRWKCGEPEGKKKKRKRTHFSAARVASRRNDCCKVKGTWKKGKKERGRNQESFLLSAKGKREKGKKKILAKKKRRRKFPHFESV